MKRPKHANDNAVLRWVLPTTILIYLAAVVLVAWSFRGVFAL